MFLQARVESAEELLRSMHTFIECQSTFDVVAMLKHIKDIAKDIHAPVYGPAASCAAHRYYKSGISQQAAFLVRCRNFFYQ